MFHTVSTRTPSSANVVFVCEFGAIYMIYKCSQCHILILSTKFSVYTVQAYIVLNVGQEGWLSPTERASVFPISQKAQFGYLRRVMPECRCLHPFYRWRHLATSREFKAHFRLPWVRLWDDRSKCHMDEKRIQCLSNASQHVPIYLQPFSSNSTRKFKSSPL